MARINIDSHVSELPADPARNLGEVLNDVILGLPANRIVTGIALNGKYISRAEKDLFANQNIQEFEELSIRTTDKAIWSANGIDMALSCIESVEKSLIVVAELYRDNNIAEANHFFAHCIEGLERFTEILMLTRSALRPDFSQVRVDQLSLSEVEEHLSLILKNILQCQERNDYPGIADRVEYELIPNLCHWTAGLKQLKNVYTSNA